MRFKELSLAAQTAYAELLDQAQAAELDFALAGLSGSFHQRTLKGRQYWYFGYRDVDGTGKMIYVGPGNERVQRLVDRFRSQKNISAVIPKQANATIALGCASTLKKHFKIVKRLSDYGLFRAGGLLIGTHAFIAYGNMLGVQWIDGGKTLDIDFAHAGNNISLALPTNLSMNVKSAIDSLEMGLLPISQFSGKVGAQCRNPNDPELRLDFFTCVHRGHDLVRVPHMNFMLEPLKFMEFLLEHPIQGCLISQDSVCMVNLPAIERFAVHKMIVYGERPVTERTKATKDILQAAALGSYFLETGRKTEFLEAWQDAMSRGEGWRKRLLQGWEAVLQRAPELSSLFNQP